MMDATLAAKVMVVDEEDTEIRDVFIVLFDVLHELGLHCDCHGHDQDGFCVQMRQAHLFSLLWFHLLVLGGTLPRKGIGRPILGLSWANPNISETVTVSGYAIGYIYTCCTIPWHHL